MKHLIRLVILSVLMLSIPFAMASDYRPAGGSASGSTDPAGDNTQVQYNNSGSFGASSNFTFTSSSNTVAATVFDGGSVEGGNLKLNGNTLSSTDDDGQINIFPEDAGDVVLNTDTLWLGTGDEVTAFRAAHSMTLYLDGDDDTTAASKFHIRRGDSKFLMTLAEDGAFRLQAPNAAEDGGDGIVMSASGALTAVGTGGSIEATTTDCEDDQFLDGNSDCLTFTQMKTGMDLNNVQNTALSSWTGTGTIVTTGALASGSIAADFGNIDVGSSTIKTTGSVLTDLIEYTDGDDAITISDGGGVKIAQDFVRTESSDCAVGSNDPQSFYEVLGLTSDSLCIGTSLVKVVITPVPKSDGSGDTPSLCPSGNASHTGNPIAESPTPEEGPD